MANSSGAKWQNLLDQLNTASNFYRPKAGKSRLRLVQLPDMVPDENGVFAFYAEVITVFRGREKPRYVVPALVMEGPGAKPEMATTITPVILPKTALKSVLSLLAEGYDLFSDEGYGVTISRTGSGLDTDYNALPSKNPIPFPEEVVLPEQTLEEMAQAFEEWANRPRAQSSGYDEESDDDQTGGAGGFVEEVRRQRRGSGGRQSGGRQQGDW